MMSRRGQINYLATLVDAVSATAYTKGKRKMQRYKRPVNCKYVRPTKINALVSPSDQVRSTQLFVSRKLPAQIKKFTGGQIYTHIDVWRQITSDKTILDIVRCCQIKFVTQPIQFLVSQHFLRQNLYLFIMN